MALTGRQNGVVEPIWGFGCGPVGVQAVSVGVAWVGGGPEDEYRTGAEDDEHQEPPEPSNDP